MYDDQTCMKCSVRYSAKRIPISSNKANFRVYSTGKGTARPADTITSWTIYKLQYKNKRIEQHVKL